MPFINDSVKAQCESLLSECFEGFKEKVTIFKKPTKTIISTSESYNFAFDEQDSSCFTYVPQSGQFYATVEYIDLEAAQRNELPIDAAKIKNSRGLVRISVESDAKDYLRSSEKIILDGEAFELLTQPIKRGIFERRYFDYYLSKIDDDNG